jgi:hypothetical protein
MTLIRCATALIISIIPFKPCPGRQFEENLRLEMRIKVVLCLPQRKHSVSQLVNILGHQLFVMRGFFASIGCYDFMML